ncbi:MAG: D-alanine--D-alanine ligase [Phycisphaerales bacterium]|nr:D-alanine--D-alanine ligase [Phycisphaerales bacterium]
MTLPLVTVLMGGPDGEREVSLASGQAVVAALEHAGLSVHSLPIDTIDVPALKQIPGDVFFPVIHGPWGEGGPLQEVLEADGRPYVGSGPDAARRCMHKHHTKELATSLGIPTPDWQWCTSADSPITVGAPAVVKPAADGSSLGLHLCDSEAEILEAVHALLPIHDEVLIERRVDGRELTVGIVLDTALPIIEIQPCHGVYDYEAKYDRNDTAYIVHPPLESSLIEALQETSIRLCRQAGVRDLGRVDFLVDQTGPWLLEINTMPGFTDHSLLPKAAATAGQPMPALCKALVESAMMRTAPPQTNTAASSD